MKQLMLIIDGMADLPCDALGGLTPLEAAHTPNLDSMRHLGHAGTTPAGLSTDSQNCILTILGMPPELIPKGRAYLEALAEGIKVEEGDLLLRLNFVGVENGRLARNCLPYTGKMPELEGCEFFPTSAGRALLRLPDKAGHLSSIYCHAPHENMGRPILEILPTGGDLADMLKDAAIKLLDMTEGAVSFVIWAPSVYTPLPDFMSLRGVRGGAVTGTPVVMGIAAALGMALPKTDGATGDTDSNLGAKLDAAIKLLPQCDFVLIHINGADEAAHRLNPKEKADFITKADRELIGPLLKSGLDRPLVVLSDHATLARTGGHHPMPVDVWGCSKTGGLPGLSGLLPATVRPV